MDGQVSSSEGLVVVESNNHNNSSTSIKMEDQNNEDCEMMDVDHNDHNDMSINMNMDMNNSVNNNANSRTDNNSDSAPSSPPPPPNKIARLSKSVSGGGGRRSNSTSNNSSSKPPTPSSSSDVENNKANSVSSSSSPPPVTPNATVVDGLPEDKLLQNAKSPQNNATTEDVAMNGGNHVSETDEEICKAELDKKPELEDGEENSPSAGSSTPTLTTTTNGPVLNFSSPALTKRSVTLPMLLAAGILKPGEGTMSLEYHGQKFTGDLLENGQIRSQETAQVFTSPSSWALACKAIINPDKIIRKSGCGWASIKYRGLKLDYYKTVWFKRLREGSIDIKNITNGTSSSDNSDDEGDTYCVLKFGEHFDSSPAMQSAQQIGAKVLISCTHFKEIERLQPFYVKMSAEALALADLHCNVTDSETVGYISGHWSQEENCLTMEVVHPCRVLMPNSSSIECDTERNRIALEIQRLGHDVVGWYHSHPRAPPQPFKDDISRQLDYQVMMKGASDIAYIPCVGLIISPISYSNQEDSKRSSLQFFWVMPPHENRPLEMGRPMHIDYETYSSTLDTKKVLLQLGSIVQFYRDNKGLVEVNDLSNGKIEKIIQTVSEWVPYMRHKDEFWEEVKQIFLSPSPPSSSSSVNATTENHIHPSSSSTSSEPNSNSVHESEKTTTSSLSSTALNSACASNSTPNSMASASTPPTVPTPTPADEPMQ